ncbi:DUF1768-domain-containing protein [Tilletiaria anomala UBC 951]|uniref:DUF1768-domain-containing protein n=1 Tax=Tilletiaria anomala (strain ATCC 24038 / CBS 436.72 / UBC 951) TaxID=1037660 RepID=A0A066VU28_TILAU|nr:DUF1768-domain-containing protein [Tilletiaria anomala UBC 951]KDN43773.1 DUF1768-domain-containing protein [Tilletiaria anomala UBC 951]
MSTVKSISRIFKGKRRATSTVAGDTHPSSPPPAEQVHTDASQNGAASTSTSHTLSASRSLFSPGANLRITSSALHSRRAADDIEPSPSSSAQQQDERAQRTDQTTPPPPPAADADEASSASLSREKGAGVVSLPGSRRTSLAGPSPGANGWDGGSQQQQPRLNGSTDADADRAAVRRDGPIPPSGGAKQRTVAWRADVSASSKGDDGDANTDEENAQDQGKGRILDAIEFYHQGAPYFWLSNSSEHAVVLDGVKYPTAEHLFQASKFPHRPDLAARIRKAPSPNAALRLARTHVQQVRPGWIRDGINVASMRQILLLKFTQHSVLRDQLLQTGDACLIEAAPNEVFWGSGLALGHGSLTGNYRGRNEKGKALMRTRDTLRVTAGLGWGSAALTV